MNAPLEALLQHPGIWRGDSLGATVLPGIPTGHAALDALLPGGGWPQGALTELIVQEEGIGELSLLLPALAALSREDRWIALVAPPYLPYAPTLAGYGVELSRLLLIRTHSTADTLWAMEQALRAGSCGAVLAWPAGVSEKLLRRLQLAAEAGGSWGVWFTPERQAASASTAALRLKLVSADGGLEVRFLKRRGGRLASPLHLDIGHALARAQSPQSGAGSLSAAAGR
jgi:protein ImuA